MTAGRRTALLCLLLPCMLVGGCRRNDLVESELRKKETLYREAVQELKRIEAQNEALQREVGAIRQAHPPGHSLLPPEIASPTFGLKRIALGRGTGGYDNDNLAGDESLQVMVEPRDGDDHVVKVPGSIHITAIEINAQGLKRPLCWWSFTAEQLRPNWKQGLLSTGYSLILPWTVFPQHENIRVLVQLKLSDGRCFEADKDVKVRLLPIGSRPNDALPPPPMFPPTGGSSESIIPSGGIETGPTTELRWSPAPATGSVEIGRPRPLAGPTTLPLPTPITPFDPVPLRE